MQNCIEDAGRRVAAEGQRSGGHLVQHRAEGEQIGALIQRLAQGLLGRHVSDGAHRGAGAGEMRIVVHVSWASAAAAVFTGMAVANPKSMILA